MQMLTSVDLPEIGELRARDEFFWLDLDDPDPDEVALVGEMLSLHRLAIEDTQEFGQRPKLDTYGDQLLLVYFGVGEDPEGLPKPVEVHMHISGRFVLTVHRDRCRQFDRARELLDRHPADSEQTLVYRVIDSLTDSILDVLDRVAIRVEEHEREVFNRPRARDRDRMAVLRRELGSLRRMLVVQRQVFDRAVEKIVALPGFDEHLRSYYRDIGDHLWRAIDDVETARESLQGMLDTYTNEVQERLTIVATIFLPLTVITGFFGMNFNWLVNHIGSEWTFFGLGMGGLVFSGLAIYLWLVRSGLYHGPRRR
jgi:magnesium transporter